MDKEDYEWREKLLKKRIRALEDEEQLRKDRQWSGYKISISILFIAVLWYFISEAISWFL